MSSIDPGSHVPTDSLDPKQQSGLLWAERIRQGDAAAFEALFRTYAPGLCVYVSRYVDSPAMAEDLVQDLFLALWNKRSDLEVHGAIGAYLFTAAKHRALNQLRSERVQDRFKVTLLERSQVELSPSANEIIQIIEVQEAVSQLPAKCRLIFSLSRQQGLTYREIADSLGLSIKTVETQMGRALKTLRSRLLQRFVD